MAKNEMESTFKYPPKITDCCQLPEGVVPGEVCEWQGPFYPESFAQKIARQKMDDDNAVALVAPALRCQGTFFVVSIK